MSLLPLLVCFYCLRILILLHSSMVLPLCPFSMSNFYFSTWCIYISLNFSPLSSISIKGVLLIDAKDWIWVDGWHLNLHFYGHYHMLEWHHVSPWDHPCRIFDLDTNRWGTSPYVIAWVIQLINLNSCIWRNLLHLMMNTLKFAS